MKYTSDLTNIWENYLSPREGGLPMQADISGGGPFNSPGQRSEDCEQVTDEEFNSITIDLQTIISHAEKLSEAGDLPDWAHGKIAVALQLLTEVANYIDTATDQSCTAAVIQIEV